MPVLTYTKHAKYRTVKALTRAQVDAMEKLLSLLEEGEDDELIEKLEDELMHKEMSLEAINGMMEGETK